MAIIRKKQVKSMQIDEMKAKLSEITVELSHELSAPQKSKNTAKVKELKKMISRINNFLNLKAAAKAAA